MVSGYENGMFGVADPVNREQIAVILWRYAGSPVISTEDAFADEDEISGYARSAAAWARSTGIIGGMNGNRFAPKDYATRAQVAVILHRYLERAEPDAPETQPMNDLGALSPKAALEYMKNTNDLVIVDVAATRWYEQNHFKGAINIPIEELSGDEEDALYLEIPEGRPVLLHCRQGAIVPGAYRRVKELRPDIPEIAYIAGAPLFDAYNEWLVNQ